MEEGNNENYETLLDDINNLLIKTNLLKSKEEKAEFIKENAAKFLLLKENINSIANKYLIKKSDNPAQNKTSEKLKKVILSLLTIEDIFIPEEFENYKSQILDMLAHYENRLMYRLRHSDDIEIIFECLDYQKDREAYISLIEKNESLKSNYFTERAVRNYINDSYERTMFENVIRIIKDDSIVISKRDSKKIIKKIDSIRFIDKLLTKQEENLQAVEKWMLQKYASVIIPLKASTYPESLSKDKLIKSFFDGKIKNEKLYLEIANAIPIEEFESLIFVINLRNASRILKEIKLGNLSEKEKKEIDELLKKAGIKINERNEIIEDDENYLVTIQDLKEFYYETTTEDIYNEKAKFYKANISEKQNGKKLTSSERKTYLEISIIIKMMTKKMQKKISPKFIEFIERNKSKRNNTDIDKNKKLKNQKLRVETKTLLALIYRDYMCPEEERKKLIKEERSKMARKDTNSQEANKEVQLAIIEHLTWYQKFTELIKRIIKRKNN